MLQGYPFYGTGAAAPTADNVTLLDPILRVSVDKLTQRGKEDKVAIAGISLVSDVPGFLSRAEVRVGNSLVDAHVIDVHPILDGNLPTIDPNQLNFIDLGGFVVKEDDYVDIRLVDPGASEKFAGVLWVEDFEPRGTIPSGRVVTLRFGGSNDGGTSLATTGFDMDSRKLQDDAVYTPYMVQVMPEDQLIQAAFLEANKDAMTLPPAGMMVYPHVPLQFTGKQWNNGQVIGKVQMVAAAKFHAILYLTESFPKGPGPGELESTTGGIALPGPMAGISGLVGGGAPSKARPILSGGLFG